MGWPERVLRNYWWQFYGLVVLGLADMLLFCARIEDTIGLQDKVWDKMEARSTSERWAARLVRALLDVFGQLLFFVGCYDMLDKHMWPDTQVRDVMYCVIGLAVNVLATCLGRLPSAPKYTAVTLAIVSLVANNAACVGSFNLLGDLLQTSSHAWQIGNLITICFVAAVALKYLPVCVSADVGHGVALEAAVTVADLIQFNAAYILLGKVLILPDPWSRVAGGRSVDDLAIFIVGLSVLWGVETACTVCSKPASA